MKSKKIKLIILFILFLLLIYIWWGNFKTFTSENTNYKITNTRYDKQSASSIPSSGIAFMKPKYNPFRRSSNKPPIEDKTIKPSSSNPISKSKISDHYALTGFVNNNHETQIIIVDKNQNTMILSLNDSLNSWVLFNVDDNFVVFKNDKLYDTLVFQTKID